jgi:polyhydroxybutyrate depolymerase
MLLTGFEQVSEQGRFIVVAPEAVDGRWDILGGGDTQYLQDVYDAVPCADSTRVYASGMSMGSGFTFALACAPERRFAAFGGVALTGFAQTCDTAAPAPIIYFHGTKDPIVPFRGGQPQGESITLDPVPAVMREWAEHNACQSDAADRLGKDVVLTTWSDCADNADIDYYRVTGGGHTWPGAQEIIAEAIEPTLGKTSQTVAASQLMWEFFRNYSLPSQG